MTLFRRLIDRLGATPDPLDPVEAYDRWAATYDIQRDNVVFALEAPLLTELLGRVSIAGKIIVDIGCGTGRHWPEILSRRPCELIGVDPSTQMLERLKANHPHARRVCAEGDHLSEIGDVSCDLIVSTLSLAHVSETGRAFREWDRILRPGGSILVTDFHPEAIRLGMKRTFVSRGRTFEIQHHATDLDRLRELAADHDLYAVFIAERAITESVRPLFERAAYLEAYARYREQPLVFGMHLLKAQ